MPWLSAMPDTAYGATLYNDEPDLYEPPPPGVRQPRHAELLDRHIEALPTPFESQGELPADAPPSTWAGPESGYGPPAYVSPPPLVDEYTEYDDIHAISAAVVEPGFQADEPGFQAGSKRVPHTPTHPHTHPRRHQLRPRPTHPGGVDVADAPTDEVGFQADDDFVNELWDSDEEH